MWELIAIFQWIGNTLIVWHWNSACIRNHMRLYFEGEGALCFSYRTYLINSCHNNCQWLYLYVMYLDDSPRMSNITTYYWHYIIDFQSVNTKMLFIVRFRVFEYISLPPTRDIQFMFDVCLDKFGQILTTSVHHTCSVVVYIHSDKLRVEHVPVTWIHGFLVVRASNPCWRVLNVNEKPTFWTVLCLFGSNNWRRKSWENWR